MNSRVTEGAGQHLILYDGVCGLCNRWLRHILPRDPIGLFHFASLQSDAGRSLLQQYGRNPDLLDTIYVFVDFKSPSPEILSRARAALFVLGRLDSPWRLLALFRVLPTFVLDAGYAIIARNRYRLFGKSDYCQAPPANQRDRFID